MGRREIGSTHIPPPYSGDEGWLDIPTGILRAGPPEPKPLSDVVGVAFLVCFTAIIITAMILVWG